jgi:hypothetical protein
VRQSSTYRGARRNDFNTVSGRRLNKSFERRQGSKGHSTDPTHILFVPPVRENKRLGPDEIKHKKVLVPA